MKTTLAEVTSDKTKKDLGVLKPGETRRQKLWDMCVSEAKELVKLRQEMRWDIVKLAEKCCVVHHGGHNAELRYTVKKFAAEIGITYTTLIEWMRLKRQVFDNLDKDQQKRASMTDLRFIDQNLQGVSKTDSKFPDRVKSAYRRMAKTSQSTIKMQKYVRHLKSIQFNVKNPMLLKDCDQEVLTEILHLAREIAFELAKNDKKKGS